MRRLPGRHKRLRGRLARLSYRRRCRPWFAATSSVSKTGQAETMLGLTSEEKKDRLSRISYRDYPLNVLQVAQRCFLFTRPRHRASGASVSTRCRRLTAGALDYLGLRG